MSFDSQKRIIHERIVFGLFTDGHVLVQDLIHELALENGWDINDDCAIHAVSEFVQSYFDMDSYDRMGIICVLDRKGIILYAPTSFKVRCVAIGRRTISNITLSPHSVTLIPNYQCVCLELLRV